MKKIRMGVNDVKLNVRQFHALTKIKKHGLRFNGNVWKLENEENETIDARTIFCLERERCIGYVKKDIFAATKLGVDFLRQRKPNEQNNILIEIKPKDEPKSEPKNDIKDIKEIKGKLKNIWKLVGENRQRIKKIEESMEPVDVAPETFKFISKEIKSFSDNDDLTVDDDI